MENYQHQNDIKMIQTEYQLALQSFQQFSPISLDFQQIVIVLYCHVKYINI